MCFSVEQFHPRVFYVKPIAYLNLRLNLNLILIWTRKPIQSFFRSWLSATLASASLRCCSLVPAWPPEASSSRPPASPPPAWPSRWQEKPETSLFWKQELSFWLIRVTKTFTHFLFARESNPVLCRVSDCLCFCRKKYVAHLKRFWASWVEKSNLCLIWMGDGNLFCPPTETGTKP